MLADYEIRSIKNNETIFKGRFSSFKACLEQAVKNNISLEHADLRYKNLSCATLDGGYFAGANFKGSNLMAANLTECILSSASFEKCSLENTFLCFSNLSYCDFRGAAIAGADICGSILKGATFNTLSALDLNYCRADDYKPCIFIDIHGQNHIMRKPPIVIKGLHIEPLSLIGQTWMLGLKPISLRTRGEFFSNLRKKVSNM